MQNSTSTMEYVPLDTDRNEIRLLVVLPGDNNSVVRCHLEHASLLNPPEFCALSYCWGDPKITTGIIINDIPIQVTINLESALRHLRAKGISILWVDAVCINQQDKTEKNQQLLWMGSIYRRAQEVHAWIGEEDDDFNESFLPDSTKESAMPGSASALVQFLDRPYWTRVWIIQELAHSQKTTIHCGSHNLDWETLAIAVSKVHDSANESTAFVNFRNLRNFQLTAARLQPLRLISALLRSRCAVSTDPRDKVFALLNLVYDGGLYLPIPNYKQSIKDLCMSMTLSGIATTSRLEILPLLGFGNRLDNDLRLPSWATNWFNMGEETIRGATCFLKSDGNYGPRLGTSSSHRFPSIKQTMGSVSMAADVLYVQGDVFDEVDGICPTYQEVMSGFIAPPCWQSDGGAIAYDLNMISETITKILTRYNLIKPQTPLLSLMFSIEELKLEQSLSKPLAWIQAVESFSFGRQSLKQLFADRDRGLLMADELSRFATPFGYIQDLRQGESELAKVLNGNIVGDLCKALDDNMRFITTRKGYVGWLHPRGRKGDKICILKGCPVPTILRARDESGFVLVGDAYIQGIMEGELFKDDSDGVDELKWETLAIH